MPFAEVRSGKKRKENTTPEQAAMAEMFTVCFLSFSKSRLFYFNPACAYLSTDRMFCQYFFLYRVESSPPVSIMKECNYYRMRT